MGYKKKSTKISTRKSKKSKSVNVKLSGTQNKATISKKKISGSSNVTIRLNVAGGSGGGGSGGGGPSFPIPYNGVNGTIGDLIPYLRQIPTTQVPPVAPKTPPVIPKTPPVTPPMTPVMPPNLKQEPIFNQPLPGEQFIPSAPPIPMDFVPHGSQPYDYFAYGPFIHSTTLQHIPRGHYPSKPYGKEAQYGHITETLEQYESFKLPPPGFIPPGTSGPSSLPPIISPKEQSIYSPPVKPAWYPPEYQQPLPDSPSSIVSDLTNPSFGDSTVTLEDFNYPSTPKEQVQNVNPLHSKEARMQAKQELTRQQRLRDEEELKRIGEIELEHKRQMEEELLRQAPIDFEKESNASVEGLQPLITEPPIFSNQLVPYQIDMSQLYTPPSSPERGGGGGGPPSPSKDQSLVPVRIGAGAGAGSLQVYDPNHPNVWNARKRSNPVKPSREEKDERRFRKKLTIEED